MTEESRPQDELAIPLELIGRRNCRRNRSKSVSLSRNPHVESRPDWALQIASNVRNDGPVCWYCGIAEAIGWFMGTLFVHLRWRRFDVDRNHDLDGGISTGKAPGNMQDPRLMFTVTAGEMLIFVLASMLAISIRYWGRTFDELNFSLPDSRARRDRRPRNIAAIIPGFGLEYSDSVGVAVCLIETFPVLKILDGLNSMELVKDMARTTSLPVMILVVAVLPAIGEELVFRGAIGRVLIANLGIWGGVLLTSFLFGWIHIHPLHAFAVMPVGLAIHLIYLSTPRFWLPMLLHFMNNSWAAFFFPIECGRSRQRRTQHDDLRRYGDRDGDSCGNCFGNRIVAIESALIFKRMDASGILGDFPIRVPPFPNNSA